MTATNIRIMEEIAEIRSSEHNIWVSIRAQPVRPVCMDLHGVYVAQPVRPVTQTGQTGPQQR